MINIRPNQVFNLIEDHQEWVYYQLPKRGGLLALESAILLSLLKIVNAKKVFEFGTYKGFTTRLFLENIESDGKFISTLDLDSLDNVQFQGDDLELASTALGCFREYLNSPKSDYVEQILIDSLLFDPAGREQLYDFIFIDANHKLEYAQKDTENAFQMLSNVTGCIAWHDYGNPSFPQLTRWLTDFSVGKPIYHVEETMLCFYLPNVDIPDSIGRLPRNSF